MNATITIELGGKRFTLDEGAYEALRGYLDRAAARLGNHPDRAEALAGLERSIAAKLEQRAPGGVCDEATVAAALREVGRVEGPDLGEPEGGGPDSQTAGADAPWHTRRLYRLRADQKIAGVCAGLAAFAEVDPNIVRLLFVVGAFFSFGLLVAAYIVLMFVMPIAHTDDEIAAAHGGRRGRNEPRG